jgi:hypothetical protein
MNNALSNYVAQPCQQPAVWPYYARPHRKGPRIDNEPQRELLSKLLSGKWVAFARGYPPLLHDLERNGWRFDYWAGMDVDADGYRLVWRLRLDAYRVLSSSAKGDI